MTDPHPAGIEHCPHPTRANPKGSWTEICCYCGATRTVAKQRGPRTGHGTFLPATEEDTTVTYGDWALP